MKMHCPHCGAWAKARTSEKLTQTSREGYFFCSNVECGHTFTAVIEINRTLSPSAIPNPNVVIPQSKHIRRALLTTQLDRAPLVDFSTRNTPSQNGNVFEELHTE